jgi:hypothetical protein
MHLIAGIGAGNVSIEVAGEPLHHDDVSAAPHAVLLALLLGRV